MKRMTLLPLTLQIPGTADAGAQQALRLRRFLMSVATYAACAVLVQLCAWLGHLPAWLPAWWAAGCALANGAFFLILRRNWNLRLRDPSMTEAQLVVSMFAVMVLIYHADDARGAFLMLFPVPLLFGVLRLRLGQMARVGAVGIGGYAAVIALLALTDPRRVQLDVEALNLLALAGVMAFVCLMGGYLSKVRAELSRSLATIREMAQRDPLTGVFNRRHLIEALDREVARCQRHSGRGLALCMIDLDHVKRINDSFGHPVGDEVLIAVGARIGKSIRSSDYVARYGGEEFAVMLEAESSDLAFTVCERIRCDIAGLQIPALQGTPLGVSIGVASCEAGDSPTDLLERADKALYRAKAEGRNCTRGCPAPAVPAAAAVRAIRKHVVAA
jgi:diguanylate cyclase (GGDEF)-like protein